MAHLYELPLALEVSGFTQEQNERKIDVLNLYGLEKAAFAQIQFAVLEVPVLTQSQIKPCRYQ